MRIRHALTTVFPWFAIFALLYIVMLRGLHGEFFFDDNPNIVQNNAIQISKLSLEALKQSLSGPTAGPLGRPLSVLSFALTYYFFALDPFAFKTINLVIHALNGLLVAWLVSLLLRAFQPNISTKATAWLPVWVAAIWLIHPINFVAVMLAVQRMTLLSGTFILLALIAYLNWLTRAKEGFAKHLWLILSCLVFWPLAVASKESGLLFPLYVLVVTPLRYWAPQGPTRRIVWVLGGAIALLGLILLAMLFYLGLGWLDTAYAARSFTLSERLLTEARVLWFYVGQIVFPDFQSYGLYLDDFTLSKSILNPPATLIAILGWLGVLCAIFYLRHKHALLSASIAWFLAAHSLESTILPLEIAQEYRNYMPSIGIILMTGYLGALLLPKLKLDNPTSTIFFAACTPILVLALFTGLRSDQLANTLTGTQIEAARHPQSARANYSAGVALIQSGYGDANDPIGAQQVRYYLQQSSANDPVFKYGSLSLIVWACASGRPVEKEWLETLSQRLQYSPFPPRDKELPEQLLKPLLSMPRCLPRQAVIKLFTAGAANERISNILRSSFMEALSDYELLVSLDPRAARETLEKATKISPENTSLQKKLQTFQLVH